MLTTKLILLHLLGAFSGIPDRFSEEEFRGIIKDVSKGLKKCRLHYFGPQKGYGVIATEAISLGDEIAIDSVFNKYLSFEDFEWLDYFQEEHQVVKAVGHLVYERVYNKEKAGENLWAHLPPSKVESIYNWTQEELGYLDNQFRIKHRIETPVEYNLGKKNYLKSMSKVPDIEQVCPECLLEETWMWGYHTVISRAFHITKYTWKYLQNIKGEEYDKKVYGICFLPLLELFNHMPRPLGSKANKSQVGVIFKRPGSAVMKADRDFRKGQEVVWSYNDHDNIKLLLKYGFILDQNIDDKVIVFYDTNGTCPGNLVRYRKKGACIFELSVYRVDSQFVKFLFKELFSITPEESEPKSLFVVLKRYRNVLLHNNLNRCLSDYKLISKKLEEGKYENYRTELVDRFCKASHWSFFLHLKLLERKVLELYFKYLSLATQLS